MTSASDDPKPFPRLFNRLPIPRHRWGTILLAAWMAVGLMAGCGGGDEAEDGVDTTASEETEQADRERSADRTADASGDTTVATPAGDWGRVDEERLERERYDRSWRQVADRQAEELRRERERLQGDRGYGIGGEEDEAPATTQTPPVRTGDSAPVVALKQRVSDGAMADTGAAGGTGTGTGTGTGDDSADDSVTETAEAGSESWEDIAADGLDGPPALPLSGEAAGPTALRVQWMLDRLRFSPGILDGRWGKNTEKAVYWLQEELGKETTGEVNRELWDILAAGVGGLDPLTTYRVTSDDLSGPFVEIPEETPPKAELDCLCYESAEEMLAERFHVTPDLLAQLNPDVDLENLAAGDSLTVPNVEVMERNMDAPDRVEKVVVSKEGFYLHALDGEGNILYHFPSTLGSDYDPSPSGSYEIMTHAYDPKFHYQPSLFPEVADSKEDLMLPGGPNSPVGVVWLDLSKENYGIHGTSAPATIGYTTSHGCVRLTNWDAYFLANHVADGTPVEFSD